MPRRKRSPDSTATLNNDAADWDAEDYDKRPPKKKVWEEKPSKTPLQMMANKHQDRDATRREWDSRELTMASVGMQRPLVHYQSIWYTWVQRQPNFPTNGPQAMHLRRFLNETIQYVNPSGVEQTTPSESTFKSAINFIKTINASDYPI
ncbi:hypothetical protein LTR84_009998 [Exophiala bonariae]|uniref:Uncharacterized protein n=1 Tax=Exophiala bonariae TaxID=1690606 RepID=A0AAV9NKX8_9EURO|nr:hypothetical protein LTR84_009998 [Exophiala bonariae]